MKEEKQKTMDEVLGYELVPWKELRALEKVFPRHLDNLRKMVKADNCIKQAIVADIRHKIVLDGSHRYVLLPILGYTLVPVKWVDYNNPLITVGSRLKHRFIDDKKIEVTKEEVIIRALTGKLFPPRTTRHFFPFRKEEIHVPLKALQFESPVDMSKYIAGIPVVEEVENNKAYIKEINEELELLEAYAREQERVKAYLEKQIKMMEGE